VARLQLALNVTDLEAAVGFYSTLFATAPAKRKPGYANFEIADPPLKLVLFEAPEGGTLNHLGVETDDAEAVRVAEARLAAAGLTTSGVEDAVCCFATKVETWVTDPDGARWEWYVKTGDVEQPSADRAAGDADAPVCCAPTAQRASVALGTRRAPATG